MAEVKSGDQNGQRAVTVTSALPRRPRSDSWDNDTNGVLDTMLRCEAVTSPGTEPSDFSHAARENSSERSHPCTGGIRHTTGLGNRGVVEQVEVHADFRETAADPTVAVGHRTRLRTLTPTFRNENFSMNNIGKFKPYAASPRHFRETRAGGHLVDSADDSMELSHDETSFRVDLPEVATNPFVEAADPHMFAIRGLPSPAVARNSPASSSSSLSSSSSSSSSSRPVGSSGGRTILFDSEPCASQQPEASYLAQSGHLSRHTLNFDSTETQGSTEMESFAEKEPPPDDYPPAMFMSQDDSLGECLGERPPERVDHRRGTPLHMWMRPGQVPSRMELEFEDLYTLGRGNFGSVSCCRKRTDGMCYAIKRQQMDSMSSAQRKMARREIFALAALPNCPNLVRYYDAWYEDGGSLLFVQMEFLQGGTLHALAHERRVTESDARRAVCDIARALQYMHDHGIAHLDVKPENILACGPVCSPLTELQREHQHPLPDIIGKSYTLNAGDVSGSEGSLGNELLGCGNFKLADLGHATLLGDDSMIAEEGDRAYLLAFMPDDFERDIDITSPPPITGSGYSPSPTSIAGSSSIHEIGIQGLKSSSFAPPSLHQDRQDGGMPQLSGQGFAAEMRAPDSAYHGASTAFVAAATNGAVLSPTEDQSSRSIQSFSAHEISGGDCMLMDTHEAGLPQHTAATSSPATADVLASNKMLDERASNRKNVKEGPSVLLTPPPPSSTTNSLHSPHYWAGSGGSAGVRQIHIDKHVNRAVFLKAVDVFALGLTAYEVGRLAEVPRLQKHDGQFYSHQQKNSDRKVGTTDEDSSPYSLPVENPAYSALRQGVVPPMRLQYTDPPYSQSYEGTVRDVLAPRAYLERPSAADLLAAFSGQTGRDPCHRANMPGGCSPHQPYPQYQQSLLPPPPLAPQPASYTLSPISKGFAEGSMSAGLPAFSSPWISNDLKSLQDEVLRLRRRVQELQEDPSRI